MDQAQSVKINYFAKEKIILYQIPPQLTESAIDNWLEPHHVAFKRDIVHRPELFLFLGGSFGKPGQQKLFLKEVVKLGYVVIHLHYPNSWTVANLCHNSHNPNCHQKTRKAIIYGQKKGKNIVINRANSLENRLVKLLLFLAKNVPEIPWLNYLHSNYLVQWQSIAIAGHSQGGGHAAMIAKDNLVSRVIMFGAPADYSREKRDLAPWLSSPSMTPAERFYGFIHFRDQAYNEVIRAWQRLGLANFGGLVNVDGTSLSNLDSHQLVTNQVPRTKDKFHGSVVNDAHTPRNTEGTPRYCQVWRYLCTHQTIH